LARIAAMVMAGKTLDELDFHDVPSGRHVAVKECVFPFKKLPGTDTILGPEMRSTGEVMGIDDTFPMAFAKSQMAANSALPRSGCIFVSVSDRDKQEIVPVARALANMNYRVLSTAGTAQMLRNNGIPVEAVPKLQEGRPNVIDLMKNGQVSLIINTPSGKGARTDEGRIRAAAVTHGVTCITTLAAAQAAVEACKALREAPITVKALQDRYPPPEESLAMS
jgi:carbamoyl-phosphate synthase large subunit